LYNQYADEKVTLCEGVMGSMNTKKKKNAKGRNTTLVKLKGDSLFFSLGLEWIEIIANSSIYWCLLQLLKCLWTTWSAESTDTYRMRRWLGIGLAGGEGS
jgi:hypothetical protein